MNARQKFEAEEKRLELFVAAGWRCVVCNGAMFTPQLAHRCAKTRARLDTFGDAVVHHPLNLVPVCSLKCNDRANIGNQREPARQLMDRIIRITTGRESMPSMAEYYAELREEFTK